MKKTDPIVYILELYLFALLFVFVLFLGSVGMAFILKDTLDDVNKEAAEKDLGQKYINKEKYKIYLSLLFLTGLNISMFYILISNILR